MRRKNHNRRNPHKNKPEKNFHKTKQKFKRKKKIRYTNKYILYSLIFLVASLVIDYYFNKELSTFNIPLIWLFVIASLYLFGKTTWLVLKKINRLNLMSDLNIWILRIISAIASIISIYILIIFGFAMLITPGTTFSEWVLVLFLLALAIIGAFGTFRFRRRKNIIGVWH
ncbi:hypothetical protein K9L97_01380 [Candidatus Woesearchaeota archaeon]|nr:hypothetical protein [Candidatus Woesearchaeota archaeon]